MIQLDLHHNGLSGSILAALGNFDKLQFLYLSHNNLTGCIPKGLRDALYHDLALPVWVSASSGRSGPWTSPVCRQ